MALLNNELYPLISPMVGVDYASNFSKHNCMQQLAFLYKGKGKLDFDIMKKAIAEEVRRNDSLTLRIRSVDKKTRKVYFVTPEEAKYEIKEADFTGRTQAEEDAYIKTEIFRDMELYDGYFGKFIFIHTCENTDSIVFVFSHFNVDGFGVFITVNDLFDVYYALKNGTEMPKPMTSFRELYEKELEYSKDDLKADSDEIEKRLRTLDPWYISERFNDERNKNKKLKKYRTSKNPFITQPGLTGLASLFHDESGQDIKHLSPEQMTIITDFCKRTNMNLQNFFYFLLRSYISAMHGRREGEVLTIMTNRRATKHSKNCGGAIMGSLYTLTKIKPENTIAEANEIMNEAVVFNYRHSQIDGISNSNIPWKLGYGDFTRYGTTAMSVFAVPDGLYEKINGDFHYLSTGCSSNDYMMYMPTWDGGMDVYFNYRTWHYDSAQSDYTFEAYEKMIARIATLNPEDKVEELYKALGK